MQTVVQNVKMTTSRKYLWYWTGIPILILIGLFLDTELDINVHDTYFVIRLLHLTVLVSLFLFVSGVGYFLLRKKQTNRFLDSFHLLTTVLGILTIAISAFAYSQIDFNYTGEYEEIARNGQLTKYCFFGILGGVLSILVGFVGYLLNLILTWTKNENTLHNTR